MQGKSIVKNGILNVIRNVSNIVFPLITFPYVSRILGVEGLGQYNFANSIVGYFVLIAGLGISNYAVREGAGVRDNREKFSSFASQMLFINILSTIAAYILLCLCMIFITKLHSYTALIWIFSLQIIFTTLGIEWLYSVHEEYIYITVRTIAVKIISLILILLFVRDKSDVGVYAAITVFALGGSSVFNLIHSRNFFDLKIKCNYNYSTHIKPILILFLASIAVMIYVYSDTTILGFLKSDYEVGLYSVASKIYTIIKSVLSSLLIVSIPRLSEYCNNNDFLSFDTTLQKIIDSITIILLPCVVGLFIMSDQIVIITGGHQYAPASISLKLLSIALFFCLYGWIYNQCVLLPAKMEKIISISTIISAGVNIVLNFALIPIWSERAAAFTTLIAELIMLIICYHFGKRITNCRIINKNFIQAIFGCLGIVIICAVLKYLMKDTVICTILSIALSITLYLTLMIITKNTSLNLLLLKFHIFRKEGKK